MLKWQKQNVSKASHHSACTDLLGNEKRDSPETTVNKDGFLQGNRRESQSTGASLWKGQPLGSGVPAVRVRPVWCTLDWAKALKIGTSFSSSTWSAQRSAMLRMWIGSSRMFWQREPRSALLLQPSSAATSPAPLGGGQERCRAHLAILLLVDGGSCLAEE